MLLKAQDLNYVAKKLGLSPEIVIKLTDETSDLNLILDQAAIKDIRKDDAKKISPLTYLKLLVFRYSHDTDFGFAEKGYVANSVYRNFLSIKKELDFLLLSPNSPISEKKSQYCLVVSGFYYDKIDLRIFSNHYKTDIEDGFRKNEKLNPLWEHIDDWLYILREIHIKNWLIP